MTARTSVPSGASPTKSRDDLHSELWSQTDNITSEAGSMHIAISLIFDVAMKLQALPQAAGHSDKLLYLAGDLSTRLESIEALAAKVCDGLKPLRRPASKEGAQ